MKNNQYLENIINYFSRIEGATLNINRQAIMEAMEKNDHDQSLTIKILSVLGGLLAGLAFVGFIALTGLLNSDTVKVIFGIIIITSTVIINKIYNSILLDTLSVTFYISGFILLILGCLSLNFNEHLVSIVVLMIALFSLSVIQNYLLSFVSVLIINFAFLSLFLTFNHFNLIYLNVSILVIILTYFFIKEAKLITKYRKLVRLYNPIRSGLVVSFVIIIALLNKAYFFRIKYEYTWLSSIVIILMIVFLLSKIFYILNIVELKYKLIIYLFSFSILLPTVLAPAISGAILVLLLSFYVNYKTGFVIGLITLIYFIIQYYYDLNFTLLTKSMLLISSGLLFILLYLFTHKKLAHHDS